MTPDISVVMGVFNGADTLAATLDSILVQRDCDFEVIVVDDGSTDATPIIAEAYASRDRRLQVMHLRHVGLTRALIAGCAAARGVFVARHDCGDRSAPERLASQRAAIGARDNIVLSAVGTRYVGPAGEPLYDVAPRTDELRRGLAQTKIDTVRGPSHHGATMFRRSAYEKVGGYRRAFEVAQDLDLWIRLAELGDCVALPDIAYETTLAVGAISHARRAEQLCAAKAILASAQRRRAGMDDADIVAEWRASLGGVASQTSDPAAFYYFLGAVLQKRNPRRARDYLRRALEYSVWRPEIWLRLAAATVSTMSEGLRMSGSAEAE